jgi:hypothetical protein
MKQENGQDIAERAYNILLELSQTNDYEFPYVIPNLISDARKWVNDFRKEVRKGQDGSP